MSEPAHSALDAAFDAQDVTEVERGEPCPAPLAWHQVLREFRDDSHPWTIERDGRKLQGRTWGTGVPLYFLNGFSGTLELFALSIWLLKDEFQCVAFDYAPIDSSVVGFEQNMNELAADLFAIADNHGDRRMNLFGTSFGAFLGLKAMLMQPKRIERAVIQNGFAHRKLTVCERALVALSCRLRCPLRQVPLRGRIQQQNHRTWFPPFDVSRFDLYLENTGAVPISEIAARACSMQQLDLRPRLAEIENEILWLRTEGEGRLAADCMRELQDAVRNAETEFLHTCGQLPFLTHPHRFAAIIRGFLLQDRTAVAGNGGSI